MSRRRRTQRARVMRGDQTARVAVPPDEVRDLVVVAAAIEGFDHAHPALLAEPVPSNHPLVTEPARPQVLTHDEDTGGHDD